MLYKLPAYTVLDIFSPLVLAVGKVLTLRHMVVCCVAEEAGMPHHEYINRNKNVTL